MIRIKLRRTIAFNPELVDIFGDVEKALFIQQLVFWVDKGQRKDGFIYKTAGDFRQETGLTRRQQKRCREYFKKIGVLEEKLQKANGVPTLHFKVNEPRLQQIIDEYENEIEQSADLTNRSNGIERNVKTGFNETLKSITENTTENTTETYKEKKKEIDKEKEKKNSRNQTPKQTQRTKKAVRKENSEKKTITQNKDPSKKEITTNDIHEKAKELIKEFAEMRNIPLDEGFFRKEIRAAHALVRQYPIEVILAGISWRLGNDDEGFWEKKLWSLNTVYSHFAEWIAEAKHRKKQKNKTFETWLDKHPEYDFRNETDQYVKATRYLQAFKEAKKAGVIFTTTEIHKRLVAAAVIRDETKTYQR